MQQTVLPAHLLNKPTYSDTNSVKALFAASMPERSSALGENITATCIAGINDSFLIDSLIIAVQLQ